MFSIISTYERDLLRKIEANNNTEIDIWRISNIAIPIITILIAVLCFAAFKNTQIEVITLFNVVLNGSIPMIALNRVGAMGIYIMRYDKHKEKKYGLVDTFFLRTKLLLLFLVIVISSMILYVYQIIHNPFVMGWGLFFNFLLSILSVLTALWIGKRIFLLQEKLIDTTFDSEMRDDMNDKGHGKNW